MQIEFERQDRIHRRGIAVYNRGRSCICLSLGGSLDRYYRGARAFALFVTAALLFGCPGAKVVDLSMGAERGVSIAVSDAGQAILVASGMYEAEHERGNELHVISSGSQLDQNWTLNVRGNSSLVLAGHVVMTPSRFYLPTLQSADHGHGSLPPGLFISAFDFDGRLDWHKRYGQFTLRPSSYARMDGTLYIGGKETNSSHETQPFILAVDEQDGTERWIRILEFEDERTLVDGLVGCSTENILYGIASRTSSEGQGDTVNVAKEYFLFSADETGLLLEQVSLGSLEGRRLDVLLFEMIDSLTAILVVVYEDTVDAKSEEHFVVMRLDLDGNVLFSRDGLIIEPTDFAAPNTGPDTHEGASESEDRVGITIGPATDLEPRAASSDSEGNVTIAGARCDITIELGPSNRISLLVDRTGFLMQIGSEGEVRWFTRILHPLYAVARTMEGDFVATGSSSDSEHTVLVRVSANGRMLPYGL